MTGAGLTTPIGDDLDTVSESLRELRSGVREAAPWTEPNILTPLAAPVRPDLSGWPRKKVRSMGRVGKLAAFASERAVAQSGIDDAVFGSGRAGLVYGSTHGSSAEMEKFARRIGEPGALMTLGGNGYLRFMSHTCAVNLGLFFGVKGRVLSTCAACVSGSQAIGFASELIADGRQDVMIAGGAEELHWVSTGVFDVLQVTSRRESPQDNPRPFDAGRDGMVVGEGAATLVLEAREHAVARGATILGEVLGFGTCCDGAHITTPAAEGMERAMRLALEDAALAPDAIDYVNAHATATRVGDVRESRATHRVLGADVPVSSTKSLTGHTLGACGAMEAVFCLAMMRDGFVAGNKNLKDVDPECAPLDLPRESRAASPTLVMSNNFAFGGINTSLIFGAPR